MSASAFYSVGPLQQIAINLFYGWGYNFYRLENQLRADDLLIRSKVGLLLGWARKSLDTAEREYRQEFLPPPSREKPRPDASAIAGAQSIEKLSRAVGGLQGQIIGLPAPENDRMTQRYRQEAETLQKLIDADQKLVGQAELLRSMLDLKDGQWVISNLTDLQEGVKAIGETLHERQKLLYPNV